MLFLFGFVVFTVGAAVMFTYRKQLLEFFKFLRYELLYWVIGAAATADDLINSWRNKLTDIQPRHNEVAIVTGGARGIGLEIVKKLLMNDMHVIIGCRNPSAGQKALALLRCEGVKTENTEVIELDLNSTASVKNFASKVVANHNEVHLLINNAGIMFVPHSLTNDGFEGHLAANYIGHYLLCHYLLPTIKQTGSNSDRSARIINVSSCAYLLGSINFEDINYNQSFYIPSEAYAQSKLAQLLFTKALDRRMRAENANVSVFAVHPGVVNTDLFNGTPLKKYLPWAVKYIFRTAEQGCRSIVFAALSPSIEGKGGAYIANCREMWTLPSIKNVETQERLMKITSSLLGLEDIGVQ